MSNNLLFQRPVSVARDDSSHVLGGLRSRNHLTLVTEGFKASPARVARQTLPEGWRSRSRNRLEIMFGRAQLACVHPFAAWTLLPTSWRVLMLTAYAAAGYSIVLGAWLMLDFV